MALPTTNPKITMAKPDIRPFQVSVSEDDLVDLHRQEPELFTSEARAAFMSLR
jgi:hypothetical protein